jgi:hypothetical protein
MITVGWIDVEGIRARLKNTPQYVTLDASHSSPLEGRWDKCVQHLGLRGVLWFRLKLLEGRQLLLSLLKTELRQTDGLRNRRTDEPMNRVTEKVGGSAN